MAARRRKVGSSDSESSPPPSPQKLSKTKLNDEKVTVVSRKRLRKATEVDSDHDNAVVLTSSSDSDDSYDDRSQPKELSSPRKRVPAQRTRAVVPASRKIGKLVPIFNSYNNREQHETYNDDDSDFIVDDEYASADEQDESEDDSPPVRKQRAKPVPRKNARRNKFEANKEETVLRPHKRLKRKASISSNASDSLDDEENLYVNSSGDSDGEMNDWIVSDDVDLEGDSRKSNKHEPPNDPELDPVRCRCGATGVPSQSYHGLWVSCSVEVCRKWEHARCLGWRTEAELPSKKYVCSFCRRDAGLDLPEPTVSMQKTMKIVDAICAGESSEQIQSLCVELSVTSTTKDPKNRKRKGGKSTTPPISVDWNIPHIKQRGWTPLIAAVERDDVALVQWLISQGADVWADDMDDATPLHHAARKSADGAVFHLLLTAAFESAHEHNNKDLVQRVMCLVDASNTTIIAATLQNPSVQAFYLLVEPNGDTDVQGLCKNSWNRLDVELVDVAVKADNRTALQWLLSHGFNLANRSMNNQFPLQTAINFGSIECLAELLEQGDVSTQLAHVDSKGRTVLHLAADRMHAELLETLLLKAQFKVDAKDDHGKTALHIAVQRGSAACVRVLLQIGHASTNVKDNQNWTPILYCDFASHADVVWELISYDVMQISMLAKMLPNATETPQQEWQRRLEQMQRAGLRLYDVSWGRVRGEEDWLTNSDLLPSRRSYPNEPVNQPIDDEQYEKQFRLQTRTKKVFQHLLRMLMEKPQYYDLLNDLLRKSPHLLRTSLSFLGQQRGLLDFNNRRLWVQQQLRDHRIEYNMNLKYRFFVLRDHTFRDSIHILLKTPLSVLQQKDVAIAFEGEVASGAGPSREFFELVSRNIVSPEFELFEPTLSGRDYFFTCDTDVKYDHEEEQLFQIAGKQGHDVGESISAYAAGLLVGLALRESFVMAPLRLNTLVFKIMSVGAKAFTPTIEDMENLDEQFAQSLRYILENKINTDLSVNESSQKSSSFSSSSQQTVEDDDDDVVVSSTSKRRRLKKRVLVDEDEEVQKEAEDNDFEESPNAASMNTLGLTFTIETESGTANLRPRGEFIPVTDRNKSSYVAAVVRHRLINIYEKKAISFVNGVCAIVPADILCGCSASEIEVMLLGLNHVDVDDWEIHTDYGNGYDRESINIVWFWSFVRALTQEERVLLLKFVTGSSAPPLGGFANLQGLNGLQHFRIIPINSDTPNILPSASTCFNMLKLPRYSTEEIQQEKLLMAIRYGSVGFSFS